MLRRFAVPLAVLIAMVAVAAPATAQLVDPPATPPLKEGDGSGEGAGTGDGEGQAEDGGTDETRSPGEDGDGVEALGEGDEPRPFGHECERDGGVLFCPTTSDADRVPSFDKVPLDVDVTLPAGTEAGEKLPTIVMLHGYGGSKRDFETQDDGGAKGDGNVTYHYNNVFYAKRGYAVINYSARGFGNSCGQQPDADPDCDDGYIHLADQRFEVRDTQHLLGLLEAGDPDVDGDDQEITEPRSIGVTGISYGGGQSTMLALLRNRIAKCDRVEDDERSNCEPITGDEPNRNLKRWESEDGSEMAIAAAFPRWPWTDLVASLLPNGRFLDFERPEEKESRRPIGIPIESYLGALYALGKTTGYYCGDGPPGPTPVCDDLPNSALNENNVRIQAGEPYTDGLIKRIANEIYHHHGASGLFEDADPAPILIENGWTDDLFPPREALRLYNELRAQDDDADVSVLFGDLGHARGANKRNTNRDFNDRGSKFFDARIEGDGDGPDAGSATVYTQTCPAKEPAEGPFEADSWREIHDVDGVSFGDDDERVVTSGGGDPATEAMYDPIKSGNNPCEMTPDEDDPGTAVYRGKKSKGYTMVGLPTVRATVDTTDNPFSNAPGAQLNSRLWDIAPDGRRTLISRGAYRLEDDQDGDVEFQLQGNAWCFEPGHRPKLELLGRDAPYLRPTTGPDSAYSVEISDLEIDIPTLSGDDPCGGGGGNDSDSREGGNGDGGDGGDSDAAAAPARGIALRAMAGPECVFFGQNFGGPAKAGALARCVSALVASLEQGVDPGEACQAQGLSGKRRRGERRSDLRACVLATTFASNRLRLLGL